jgi:hypothetical protein
MKTIDSPIANQPQTAISLEGNHIMDKHTITLTTRELATVRAALQFWRRTTSDETEQENEIATGDDTFPALQNEEIDALVARIATPDSGNGDVTI